LLPAYPERALVAKGFCGDGGPGRMKGVEVLAAVAKGFLAAGVGDANGFLGTGPPDGVIGALGAAERVAKGLWPAGVDDGLAKGLLERGVVGAGGGDGGGVGAEMGIPAPKGFLGPWAKGFFAGRGGSDTAGLVPDAGFSSLSLVAAATAHAGLLAARCRISDPMVRRRVPTHTAARLGATPEFSKIDDGVVGDRSGYTRGWGTRDDGRTGGVDHRPATWRLSLGVDCVGADDRKAGTPEDTRTAAADRNVAAAPHLMPWQACGGSAPAAGGA
jgi:hypothetical protein